MFPKRKTILYFCPHQDDELLTMGVAICADVQKKRNVHVILCTDGSKSSVRNTLKNGKRCSKHDGTHIYDLSAEEFIQARDLEFIGSCTALGVKPSHIHIPENRDMDGSLSVKKAEQIIRHYLSVCGENALVCTISPTNGSSQHQDHKALGKAADNLLRQGVFKEVRFFIEPYHFTDIQPNPRLIPVDPTITSASKLTGEAIETAISSYSCWSPENHRYAIGYHSVAAQFDDFRKAKNAYSFTKYNLRTVTLLQRLCQQHKKWLKLHKQTQLFYSISGCDQPDLGSMRVIPIQPGQTDAYQDFCSRYHVELTDKNLQRLKDGSSFWCLAAGDERVLSSGWLAYRQLFYIGETDFGFDMSQSKTAILYDFRTEAEHRGNGYYGLLLRSIVHNAKEADRYIIYTSFDNQSSSKGILKAGFQFDGVKSASDHSMQAYLRKEGFTSITRKNRLWGLWIHP